MMQNSKVHWLLLIIMVSLPIWAHISELPIQLWDESRLAINAFEMYKDHDWITTHFNGEPDLWNTKPPLLIWLQVISFHIFGVNEFALRIPSAIAGTLTCLLLYWFCLKKMKNPILGFISVAVLISSFGFIKHHHSPRTGDYDALLTLFVTAFVLFYYIFLEEGKQKYMYLTMICLILGVMTKSIAALLCLPAIFIYTVYKRKLGLVFRSHGFYAGLISFCIVVLGYYLLREHNNPGYTDAVKLNDLGGRMSENLGSYRFGSRPFFYYDLIKDMNMKFWYVFIPIGILLGLYATENFRGIIILSTLFCINFFVILSIAINKYDWYDMPMMPFLSIIISIGIYTSSVMLSKVTVWKGILTRNVLPYIFLLLPAIPAYLYTLTNSFNPDPGEWIVQNTSICKYLKDMYHGNIYMGKDVYILADKEYQANIDWYVKVLQHEKHINVWLVEYDALQPFQKVLVYKDGLMSRIENDFNYNLQERVFDDRVRIYQLNGKKQ